MIFVGLYYYNRWKPLWSYEDPRTFYSINHHHDDTLRIVMIGDSWAGIRTDTLNNMFQVRLSEMTNKPVKIKTKGKGGEESRRIYQLMFEEGGFGTKSLLMSGPDYCVVFAGINDAALNLGTKQYVHHMKLLLDHLCANNIRPILIEIPNVNIWTVYGEKPLKDLLGDYIKSLMIGCGMYRFSEYREALLSMLKDSDLIDSVLYVSMCEWNGDDAELNKSLFLYDQKHLNSQGYQKLDSCISKAIYQDLKQSQDTAFVN